MFNLISKVSAILVFVFVSSLSLAQNKIYIDVGAAKVKKSLVALPPFQYYGSQKNSEHLRAGQTLFNVVSNDLSVSSLFTFISQDAYLEDTTKVGLRPAPGAPNGFDFQSWKSIGTEFLIRGGYKVIGDKLNLEIYVYYVPQAKLVFGKTYEGPIFAARKMAHSFANDLVEKLTNKPGMFTTQMVVSRRNDGSHFKEIYVMDWDGQNERKITDHRTIATSPAWSPDGKKIAYSALLQRGRNQTRNWDLLTYELPTGKRWLVSTRKGNNTGAAFLPDGNNLLLTMTFKGNPDIFRLTGDGENYTQITFGPYNALNMEPAISADNSSIAFSSTRSGRPMIYTMNTDGSTMKRLTFAGVYNSSPAWSPDGKMIAFAGQDKGHFDIFVMKKDGTGLSRLTSARRTNGSWANNEDPSFSPDGRHIMFSSDRTGKYQIYIVNVYGTNERRITFDKNEYFRPKWSPFLQ